MAPYFGDDSWQLFLSYSSVRFIGSIIKYDKLCQKILNGTSDANIAFSELCQFLIRLGFEEWIRGDHHIFTREDVEEIINLQPRSGKAKNYQVKQVRTLILKYKLRNLENDND